MPMRPAPLDLSSCGRSRRSRVRPPLCTVKTSSASGEEATVCWGSWKLRVGRRAVYGSRRTGHAPNDALPGGGREKAPGLGRPGVGLRPALGHRQLALHLAVAPKGNDRKAVVCALVLEAPQALAPAQGEGFHLDAQALC